MKNNLRIILAEQRLKVSDLHNMTGLTIAALTNIFYERSNPNIQTMVKIAKALNVSLDDLITLEELEF